MPLSDLKVVDMATVLAGPGCARYLADFGAQVIKVERPGAGDTLRGLGWSDHPEDDSYFWKMLGRGKRCITLDLKDPADLSTMKRLCAEADVLVENLRPGKLEALGLIPDELIASNPRLVITRVTAFGQEGPYSQRPGFATLAEAMSGLAAISGHADGPPLLPPIALTDEVTALAAAFATLVAVHSGRGQVIDVSLLESISQMMGPLMTVWRHLGELQPRMGSGLPYSTPRGTYLTSDGRWLAVSASSSSVAARVMALVGLEEDERFATFVGRAANRQEVEDAMARWVADHTLDEAMAEFDRIDAAAAPVMSMADLDGDPHATHRELFVEVDGITMQGLVARLSETPGRIRWAGRPLGHDDADFDPEDPWGSLRDR